MTVEELEEILSTVKNKKMKVCISSYSNVELNGYFYRKEEDKDVLLLTSLNVQPRL